MYTCRSRRASLCSQRTRRVNGGKMSALAPTHYAASLSDIRAAADRLRGVAHETPTLSSRHINERLSEAWGWPVELFFKAECLQRVGAFKFRGAWSAVSTLSEEELARGVCTHSSGNHAQALALAARERRAPAYIVMPTTAPAVKRAAVEGYGATVIECAPTLTAREEAAAAVVSRTGARFIHPYNDPLIIAGQGTAALELIEQAGPLELMIAPIGGGGLMSGTCLTTRALCPTALLWGAEPTGADDAARSLAAGHLIPQESPKTICDGLLTSLGDLTWPVLRDHLARIVTVTDAEVIEAMRLLWTRLKVVVEPSGAAPLAALFAARPPREVRRVGVILSGGNIDLDRLPWGAPH
jgi:threonine dehydratase